MRALILLSCVVALAVAKCPANSHYERCGTACPLTCKNLNPPKDVIIPKCVFMCNPGCHCDEGYVKTEDGQCVPPTQCPESSSEVCGENQHYSTCGTACPLTCENLSKPNRICTLQCVIGCQCKPGYVRAKDGRCVKPQDCPAESRAELCSLEAETGLCRGFFPRYHFDSKTGQCEKFVYGGCGGNDNNFESRQECESACAAKAAALDRSDCDKGPVTGLCNAYFERFYYDQEEGMCKKFIYGGCGGNRNNFASEDECYNKCGALSATSACSLDVEVGPCRAAFPRYFFNIKTGKCEKFTYGGCLGNENNFRTQEACERTCSA